MEPSAQLAFAYGFGGSLVIEIIVLLRVMGPRGAVPAKYKTGFFWFLRLLLAFISGCLATAYFTPQIPLYLYAHIGAATPAIFLRISRMDPADESKDDDEPPAQNK
jgi:hypothetical protein